MKRPDLVAGAPGFEPGNGGIKIRCLTTWLHPITAAWKTGARAPAERHHNQSPKEEQWCVAMRSPVAVEGLPPASGWAVFRLYLDLSVILKSGACGTPNRSL